MIFYRKAILKDEHFIDSIEMIMLYIKL